MLYKHKVNVATEQCYQPLTVCIKLPFVSYKHIFLFYYNLNTLINLCIINNDNCVFELPPFPEMILQK